MLKPASLLAAAALALTPAVADARVELPQLIAAFGTKAHISGQITVQYHGSHAAGCAARGLCDYSGTLAWQPPTTGDLEFDEMRLGHRTFYSPDLSLGNDDPSPLGAVTTVQQQSWPPGSRMTGRPSSGCTDAEQAGDFSPTVVGSRMTFALADASLQTRCAGPLDGDLNAVLTRGSVSIKDALRGGVIVRLDESPRSFASHGFAGTVSSDVTIRWGRPHREGGGLGVSFPQERIRYVRVSYRAVLSGAVTIQERGDENPVLCEGLGSCGLSGALTLRLPKQPVEAKFAVSARAHRPFRDLMTALGLQQGGNTRGLVPFGGVFWSGGTLTANLNQPPSIACSDSAPAGGASINFEPQHGSWASGLTLGGNAYGDLPRTRCPGPNLTEADLASARLPINMLTHASVEVPFVSGSTFRDDGYTARVVPHLMLELTKRHIKRATITFANLISGGGGSGGGSTTITVTEGTSGSSGSFSGSFFGSGSSSGSNGGGFFSGS